MLELVDIHKTYARQPLLSGISFSVAAGETVCLLGASGSGKSTLLRVIAGLEHPESGQVLWNGADLASVATHQRNFGFVFQDYALFPHLTVAENVAFGLKMQNIPKDEIKMRVTKLLEQVNMIAFANRNVTDLSGGEQQRAALARALGPHPRLLMFDEPLGALDRVLRDHLLEELRDILHISAVPAIYVTHDQEEAFLIADRIMLLHDGHIVQAGPPEEVYANPASVWVANFLGLGNVLEGIWIEEGRVQTPLGVFEVDPDIEAAFDGETGPGMSVTLLIRPERVALTDKKNHIKGHVAEIVFKKNGFRIALESGFYFYLPTAPQVGQELSLAVQVELLK